MELPLELSDSETNKKTLTVTEEETEVWGGVGWGDGDVCPTVLARQRFFLPERERAEGSSSSSAATTQQVERVATVESTFELTGELRVVAQLHGSQTHVYSGLGLETK